MGAVAVDYVGSSVNNVTYVGNGAVKKAIPNIAPVVVRNVASSTVANVTAFRVAGSVLSRVNPYLFAAKTAYDIGSSIYDYLTEDEKADLSPVELEAVNQAEEYVKNVEFQKQKADDLQQKTDEINNSVTYEQGQSLPSVLTQNAKALTQSVNTLNSTMSEQMTLQNNYMQGLLIYLEQFLQLQTEIAPLKIDAMNYQKNTVSNSVLSETNMSGLSPREIQVLKNSYDVDANDFQKNAVSNSVLSATNLSGLSPREIQVSKHSYDVEAKEYAKAPQTVKDCDGNELLDISPREARLVKDSTLAIDTTDKINFELDTEDIDIVSPIDISSVFGYEKNSEIFRDLYVKFGGVGDL